MVRLLRVLWKPAFMLRKICYYVNVLLCLIDGWTVVLETHELCCKIMMVTVSFSNGLFSSHVLCFGVLRVHRLRL